MKSGQIVQFPLTRGLTEDENKKARPVASLKSGVNVRWPRSGTIGKRFGASQLGDSVSGIRRFIRRGEELAATDGEQMIVYDAESETWTETGRLVSEAALDWSTIHDDQAGVASSDLAVSGDLVVHAWVSGDPTRIVEATPQDDAGYQAYVQILNRNTGQVVLAPVALEAPGVPSAYTFRHVRVLLADVYAFVLVTWDGSVVCYPIILSTRTVGASQSLKTNVRTGGYGGRFDACFLASGNLALVYEKTTPAIEFVRFTRSGATFSEATSSTHAGTGVRCIRIAEDATASRLYILYGVGGELVTASLRVRAVHNSTGASVISEDLIETFRASQVSIALLSTGTMVCAASGVLFGPDPANNDIVPMHQLVTFRIDNSGAIVSDTTAYSIAMTLLSDLFVMNERWYFLAADGRYGERQYAIDPENDVPTYTTELSQTSSISSYLLEVTTGEPPDNSSSIPHRLVGKIDHDIAAQFQIGLLPQVWAVDDDEETFLGLVPFQAATDSPNSFNWRCGLKLVRMTIDPDLMADPWHGVSIGRETYLSGGILGVWDGRAYFDHGMRTPHVYNFTSNGSGGAIANGTYIYQFGPGYRSHAGVLHRGPLSRQITVTQESANGTASLQIDLASAGIDGKQTIETGFGRDAPGNAFFDAFRTEANGSTLYQLTYAPRFNKLPNDPGEWTTSLTDTKNDDDITDDDSTEFWEVPDIALSSRPQPYTVESLEEVQPPGSHSIHIHNGRLFLIDGSRRTVWYSKDFRENPGVAPGFNFELSEVYDVDLVKMASLYAQRVVFHERGLFVVEGDGPNAQGLDNSFSTPRPIQSDVGCTNPRSVVSWAGGVIFQSDADLYNLGGDLSVTWISRDVRDTLAAYPQITSAVLVSDQNEIRFTCNNEAGTEAIVLVFDYQRSTWLTRTYASGAAIRDATLHGGRWLFATANAVYEEDTSTHLDAGAFVPSTVELEPLTPAGVVGWNRVKLLKPIGQSLSNHALTVSISRDWAASYEQTEAFAAGSAVTTVGPYERAEVAITVQRRQAVGLKFVDSAPANTTTHPLGNGAGFELEGVALLVQPRPGMPRDLSTRRGG